MISDSPEFHETCARRLAAAAYPAAPNPLCDSRGYVHDRIRVAYLSADFHDHPVAHLLIGIFEGHDRKQFEIIGVSLRAEPQPSAMTERTCRAFDQMLDAADWSDRSVARRLRDMEVDIAVDLTGLTRGGRLGILAERPAPVQVNFLGYAGTYGTDYIDYVIADEVVIPREQSRYFCERIVRLPHSFIPNDDRQIVACEVPNRREAGLPERGFVYCAFSNAYKLNPVTFDVWMRLLRETAGSVLWLRVGGADAVGNLRREAAARGVDPDRLIFAPRVADLSAHLARYRLADLFLDTTPYGAHATARDALWAGLPVLTCAGNAFPGRVAASLLTALGLGELITTSLSDYAALALDLYHHPDRLDACRRRLNAQRAGGVLFDTRLYRTHLERAYRVMSERLLRGESPTDLDVVPST
jgi:predicted O-linked N-acetylglucosamine transferase (SPINDLY family)